jgi:uncharacterized protein YnzC (UPF0291/DUF896 family)
LINHEDIIEKLEELASDAERESMHEDMHSAKSILLSGYISGIRDAIKLVEEVNGN